MITCGRQARNGIFLCITFLCVFVAFPAIAAQQNPGGPVGAGGEKPVSVGEAVGGFFQSIGDAISSLGKSESPAESPKPKEPAKAEAQPKMIEAKRIDQPVKEAVPAVAKPAAPYKVYSFPTPAEEQVAPLQSATTSRQGRAASSSTKSPPLLPDDIKHRLEDMVVNPPLTPEMTQAVQPDVPMPSMPERKAETRPGEVPPTSALPKQFFPVFPVGAGEGVSPQLLPLSSNIALEDDHSETSRVIIVVHDIQRNSAENVATLMTLYGSGGERTLIIAPQFSLDIDIARFAKFLPDNGRSVTRWSLDDPWQWGGESKLPTQPRGISSFTAMDILLLLLTDRNRFPALQQVVLSGHGLGADYVQRYAMLGQAPDILKEERIATRFVIANPSSFMYPTNIRPLDQSLRFGAPTAFLSQCPKLNSYPYGINDLPTYAKRTGGNAARMRYPERRVVYLAGDNIMSDNYMDRNCEAMVQGNDRLMRSRAFSRYMMQSFGDISLDTHVFALVPKAGYDPVSLYGSPCGMAALFGNGKC